MRCIFYVKLFVDMLFAGNGCGCIYYIFMILCMINHMTGINSDGSILIILQSLSLSSDNPDATIISPPTIINSAMSASLIAVLDSFATR